MARGRRGASVDTGAMIMNITTRHREASPYYDPIAVTHKAHRIGYTADLDAEDLSKRSRDRDRKLLNSITQRLNRVEYDGVKMGRDVAEKTGFRRYIYNQPHTPIERETRAKRRRNELKYPWDNTVTNNFYRGVNQSKTKVNKKLPKKTDYKLDSLDRFNKKSYEKKEYSELPQHLPEHDPMGVYRPRPKRERKDWETLIKLAEKPYYDMPVREMLSRTRAKVEAMPRARDTQRDVDSYLSEVLTPLPKNDMSDVRIFTIDGYYDEPTVRPGLDDHLKSKFKQSHADLQDFDRMLEMRFGGPKKKSFTVPSRTVPRALVKPAVKVHQERELGMGLEPDFDEPTVIHRTSRPVVRASPTPIRYRTAGPVHTAAPSVRVRSSSVPASARVVPRNRSRIADIEVDKYLDGFVDI